MTDAAEAARRQPIDAEHTRPPGLNEAAFEALGEFSKALETIHRVRGHLYSFHQLIGKADLYLDRVVELLREGGQPDLADRVETELLGRNVLPGRWTFQIVEEFDDGYYAAWVDLERAACEQLAGGRRHLYEADMKQRRRTPGRPGHEAHP